MLAPRVGPMIYTSTVIRTSVRSISLHRACIESCLSLPLCLLTGPAHARLAGGRGAWKRSTEASCGTRTDIRTGSRDNLEALPFFAAHAAACKSDRAVDPAQARDSGASASILQEPPARKQLQATPQQAPQTAKQDSLSQHNSYRQPCPSRPG